MVDAAWKRNGGEVRKAAEVMAASRQPGAVLFVDVEWDSLQRVRADGMAREREGELLRVAWDTVIAALPPLAVGRRVMWSRFEFVLEGDQAALAPLGARVVSALVSVRELASYCWHLVFIEVFAGEPERTFCCDPGYDVQTVKGRTAILWVKPYASDDWREPQRYPTVTFLDVEA
jgi:hypothetical protein